VEGAVKDGDVGEIGQRLPRLLDRRQGRRVVQRRELDGGFELLLNRVVDHDRLAKASAAVDDTVGNGRDNFRDRVEGLDRRCRVIGLDNGELQARRAGVDD
jgi:hypothetical protein